MTLQHTAERMASWLERAWMSRYLDRQLSGEESNWFETYVLDKPELLSEIDADTNLRDALSAAAISAQEKESPTDNVVKASSPAILLAQAKNRFASLGWLSLAAALALGVGIGTMMVRTDMDRPEIVANPTRVIFDVARGTAQPPRIELKGSQSTYVLLETPIPIDATDISLMLDRYAPTPLLPTPDGYAGALVRRDVLAKVHEATVHYRVGNSALQQRLDLSTFQAKETVP